MTTLWPVVYTGIVYLAAQADLRFLEQDLALVREAFLRAYEQHPTFRTDVWRVVACVDDVPENVPLPPILRTTLTGEEFERLRECLGAEFFDAYQRARLSKHVGDLTRSTCVRMAINPLTAQYDASYARTVDALEYPSSKPLRVNIKRSTMYACCRFHWSRLRP